MKVFRRSLFGYKRQDVSQYMDEVLEKLVLVKEKHQIEVDALKASRDRAEKKCRQVQVQLEADANQKRELEIQVHTLKEQVDTLSCQKEQSESELLSLREQYGLLEQKYDRDYLSKKEELDAAGRTMAQVQALCDRTIDETKEETERLMRQMHKEAEDCMNMLASCGQTYSLTKSNILKCLGTFEEELDSIGRMIDRTEDKLTSKNELDEIRRRNVKRLDELKRNFMHIVRREEA